MLYRLSYFRIDCKNNGFFLYFYKKKAMPLQSILIIIALVIQILSLAIAGYFLRKKGSGVLGTPSIDPLLFILGKISAFICWLFIVVKIIFPDAGLIQPPVFLIWISVGFLHLAALLIILSFTTLSHSTKIGLPFDETELRTRGIYSISRNPMYLSVYLICIASVLFFPDLVNLTAAITAIILHHKIIIGEEEFLGKRFGNHYSLYRSRVNRYI